MTRGDFVVVTHPSKAPAVDFITRSGEGPFVDTGVDIIMRSQPGMPVQTERVYLAFSTIRQLAQLAEIETSLGLSGEREAQLIARGKLEGLREAIDGQLVDLGHTLRRWLDDAGVGIDSGGGAKAL